MTNKIRTYKIMVEIAPHNRDDETYWKSCQDIIVSHLGDMQDTLMVKATRVVDEDTKIDTLMYIDGFSTQASSEDPTWEAEL